LSPEFKKITAIEPQKRRQKRRSVFVDGEFFAGVGEEVVLALGLHVGQQVDAKRLEEMLRSEELRTAREDALKLLGYRSRSANELERRLKKKGYEDEIVRDVLASLTRVDLLSDERFTADWIRSRMASKPMGRTMLRWELRQKGIAPELIEEALEEIDEEREFKAALALAEKKASKAAGGDAKAERRRLADFLRRRGFAWETVKRALNEVFGDEEEF